MRGDYLGLVEAAYDLELAQPQWLRRLAHHARSVVEGASFAIAYTIDVSDGRLQGYSKVEGVRVPSGFVEAMDAQRATDEQGVANLVLGTWRQRVATMTQLMGHGEPQRNRLTGPILRLGGIEEMLACVGLDAEGRGVALSTDLPKPTRLSPSVRARWQLVTVHLAAACRLRRRFALGGSEESVLSPGGRMLHAEGEAAARDARERLREAVVSRDRARTRRMRADPGPALAMWDGLVAGRWTLIDRFESDGRRYVVAHRNETDPAGPPRLTRRERQVVSHLLQGDSLKVTAYALGVAQSTVSEARARALLKLGVRTLADLALLAGTVARP
jgi:DNA-binding CsgD family transcriptional regulator